MRITRLETDLLRVPLPRPVSLPASQDPRPASHVDVVLVRLLTDGPHTGLGFTYTFGGGVAVRALLDSAIAPIVVGLDPMRSEWLFHTAWAELEGIGFAGLAARAFAAVDFAVWDLKGKAANAPLYELLGGYRTALKPVAIDTATPALGLKQAVKESKAALDRGAAGIQIEVGTNDPDLDYERVRQLRDDIPDGAWFEVNCSGRYDFATAAWLGTVGTEELGLDGYSDPLRPEDAGNLRRLADRLDVGVSVGGLFDRPEDFVRAIDAGGIEAVRIDPLRLGGITPARKVIAAAELKHVAVYPARCPEVGGHLGLAFRYGRMCEWTDWFSPLFDGGPVLKDGQMVMGDRPGLGLAVKDETAAKWRIG
jgi:L-alanine-DL-glutamate epimerase-like enolase superfamily enzyme